MRTLEFEVNDQNLSKSPDSDFTGIVMGSVGYLSCKFHFGKGWEGVHKAVEFSTKDDSKFFAIGDENDVVVPKSITAKPFFKVSIHGVTGTTQFETNKVLIRQERSM